MSLKKFLVLKPWLALGIFVILWWAVPAVFKRFSENALYEFQAPVWDVHAKVKDLQTFWGLKTTSKNELIEAGRDLARLNASYELTLAENAALKDELGRLESLLDVEPAPEFHTLLARVLRRNLQQWSHYMYIHKGKHDGVIDGAAVVNSKGIVGRVKKAYGQHSLVELVSSPTFRIAARFKHDIRPITYQGKTANIFTKPEGLATNVPNDVSAKSTEPLELVTSRLGGMFPDGLTIGLVEILEDGEEGLFQKATVELSDNLHSISEVAVLIPIDELATDSV